MLIPNIRCYQEEDLPSPGLKVETKAAEKVCRVCGGLNGLAETSCIHCQAEFKPRQVSYRQCECGAFCRMSDARRNNCGKDIADRFAITLTAAARDGVITRGIDVPEDEVAQAEDLALAHRMIIEKAERENQVLARILRTVPVELMPSFLRLVTE